MGYHTKRFKKGVYGDVSKIQEEMEEFLDAWGQQAKLLMLCELADLYGAIAGYVEKHFPGMTMTDLAVMSKMTREAFEEGDRVSVEEKDTRPPKSDCGYCQGTGWVGDGSAWSPREACHCRNWKDCPTCKGMGRVEQK